MSLSPNIETITQALLDNADFESSRSLTKAKLFVTAATQWLIFAPQETEDQHSRMKMNNSQIEKLLARAQEFVATNDSSNGGSVSFLSAENFR